MAEDRKKNNLIGIEPDSKSQVTMLYENGKPSKVTSVVISTQHSKNLDRKTLLDKPVNIVEKQIAVDIQTPLFKTFRRGAGIRVTQVIGEDALKALEISVTHPSLRSLVACRF